MKRIFTLMFGLSFVLYLSGTALAQGKVGGHAPEPAHRDVDNNRTHGKADAREDGKEGNFIARIQRNPELSQKLQALLPKTGPNSTLTGAAMGFRNEGQFIAALHVSKNLGIPFDQLKAKMMSGDPPMKLGQAIHALKPNVTEKDADNEADKAEKEARADVRTKRTAKPVT
jgi:hypothetical protein